MIPAARACAITCAYCGSVLAPGPLAGLMMTIPTVGAAAITRCHSGPGAKYAGTAMRMLPGKTPPASTAIDVEPSAASPLPSAPASGFTTAPPPPHAARASKQIAPLLSIRPDRIASSLPAPSIAPSELTIAPARWKSVGLLRRWRVPAAIDRCPLPPSVMSSTAEKWSGLGPLLSYVPVEMPSASPPLPGSAPAPADATPWFLQGGGISGATARAVPWQETPLGAPDSWPSTLKTTLATMFRARQPMFLWWGRDLIQFYNDAYLPSFGRGKHPRAMGQFGRECWREIWPIIGPQIEDVMKRGIASWNEDSLVPILRNGRIEDVYWTYTYSPVFGETGAVEATLVICTETTNRVLGERRANMLHALVGETSLASDRASLIATALATIRRAAADLPFGGFYERDPTTAALAPAATAGMDHAQARAVGERVRAAIARRAGGGAFLISAREAQPATSGGDSADSADDRAVRDIYVAPLPSRAVEQPLLLVLGLSPQLSIDESYRRFLEQVSGHLQLAKIRVDEAADRAAIDLERRRLVEQNETEREELLGELQSASRAKDEFLAMLGHELRNPLSPIITALRLMRHKSQGAVTREQQVIERQVNHLIAPRRRSARRLDASRAARSSCGASWSTSAT